MIWRWRAAVRRAQVSGDSSEEAEELSSEVDEEDSSEVPSPPPRAADAAPSCLERQKSAAFSKTRNRQLRTFTRNLLEAFEAQGLTACRIPGRISDVYVFCA
eukprot:g14005.t1